MACKIWEGKKLKHSHWNNRTEYKERRRKVHCVTSSDIFTLYIHWKMCQWINWAPSCGEVSSSFNTFRSTNGRLRKRRVSEAWWWTRDDLKEWKTVTSFTWGHKHPTAPFSHSFIHSLSQTVKLKHRVTERKEVERQNMLVSTDRQVSDFSVFFCWWAVQSQRRNKLQVVADETHQRGWTLWKCLHIYDLI